MSTTRSPAAFVLTALLAGAGTAVETNAGSVCPCLGDLTGNGIVDGADLGQMLSAWGACSGCPADVSGNGTVDGADLGILLSAWGACGDDVPNDTCADATVVVGFTGSANPYCTIGATTDGPSLGAGCGQPEVDAIESDVWFRVVAPTNGTLQIGVCGDFPVRVAVYDGAGSGCPCVGSAGFGTLVGCAGTDDYPTCAQGAVVLVPALAGECFMVRIGGAAGQQGTGTMDINVYSPPCDLASTTKLSAGGIEADSEFGLSVSIDGDRAVATAFYDDVLFGPANAGSARIHGWNGSGWTATQTLLSPAPFNGERFGLDSAIRGNWIIVGAGAKDPACEADPNCDTGSAFVYRFDGGSWVFDQKLLPTGGSSLDSFGVRVDIDGNRAIVGAGDDTNANGSGAGAAYVYGFNPLLGGNWFQSAKLLAPVGMAGDRFGADVGVSGVWAIVGSDSADGPGETNAGRADMFRNGSGGWTHEATLVPDALIASSRMGRAVAIDGSVAVIGAPGNSNAPGAAYVYELVDGLNWTLIATLTAHDGANGDSFGSAVAVRGDQILVGASGDDGARGGAYLFWRVHGGWVQRAKLTAADGVASDVFSRVAIDNGRGLVGAYLDDTGSLTDVGSVYVFKGLGDCNGNVVVDACDIAAGMPDTDADGIPDMCEP